MRILLAALTAFSALASLPLLEACDCAPPPPPKEAFAKAAAVFQGEVTEVREAGNVKIVTLKVDRWWKGNDAEQITVSTSRSGASCGYPFQTGNRYLVYAHGQAIEKEGLLHASLCSRTRTSKEAEASGDFTALGEGTAPAKKK